MIFSDNHMERIVLTEREVVDMSKLDFAIKFKFNSMYYVCPICKGEYLGIKHHYKKTHGGKVID